MTTTLTDRSATTPPVQSPIVRHRHRATWLAITAGLLAVAIVESAQNHLGPWPILAFIMAPDLSFLAGLGATAAKGQLPPRAVPIYNLVHRPWIPLALIAVASSGAIGAFWLVAGVSWLTHIAMDRTAGYRLRAKDGWQRD